VNTFFFFDVTNPITEEVQRHIIQPLAHGGVRSFPATNDNPNMFEYLAWVAEGNVAEPWQPEESVIAEQPVVEEPVIEDAN
jgi:hypothetical protein